MNAFLTLWRRCCSLWQSRAVKQEIDDELQFHIAMREQENLRAGMAPQEAAREARRRFGNFQSVREECRELRGVSFGRTVWQDVQFGLRMLRKNPGFTTVAILTLALGIGVNTTMFSMVKMALFCDLPFPEPERLALISIDEQRFGDDRYQTSADYFDLREQNTVFTQLGALHYGERINCSSPGAPAEGVRGVYISAEFLPALGVQPLVGRHLTPEENQPGHTEVVVLNREFWQRRFNGDPQIVGRTVRLDGKETTVVGVVDVAHPLLFYGPLDVLCPLELGPGQRQNRNSEWLVVVGRLKPGVSLRQAKTHIAALGQRIAHDHPKEHPHLNLSTERLGQALLNMQSRRIFYLMLLLTGFVLLIACANLANLQLARLASRTRELGIRASLGAGRARLARQLLTESLVLALLGGAAGLLLAWVGNHWLGPQFTMEADGSPLGLVVRTDRTVVAFAFLISALSGMVVGTAPVWFLIRGDLNVGLLETRRTVSAGRAHHRLQNALIVAEIALALPLLAVTGLSVVDLGQKLVRPPGWHLESVATGAIALSGPAYDTDPKRESFLRRLQERVSALPGVQSVSLATDLPFEHDRWCRLSLSGQTNAHAESRLLSTVHQVDAQYFQTLGITLRQGRNFTAEEAAHNPPVTVINQGLADKLWPGQSPLGKRLPWNWNERKHWPEVIGVVNDLPEVEQNFQVYRPRGALSMPSLLVRVTDHPQALAGPLRQLLAELDPDLPLSRFMPARNALQAVNANNHILGGLIVGFGALGLLLAVVGVYGVTAHVVSRRTQEFGIRLALGAPRANVLWLVLRNGLRLGALGTLLGIVGGTGLVVVLKAMLADAFGTTSLAEAGPWLFVGSAALVMVGAVLAACWLPARRATRIDPMSALRYE
jgi:putative ABC transport system permease protein